MRLAPIAALASGDFMVQRSYRLAFVSDIVWGLIDLVLYYFISRVVGRVAAADLGNAPSYFAFAIGGLLMALVVTSATSSIAERVRQEEVAGTLEAVCAQPVRATELAAGWAAFPIVYAAARAAVYLLFAVVILDLATRRIDWLGFVVTLAAATISFLPLGILAAAAAIVFKRGQTIVAAVTFAMTFAGGAFFPLGVLPGWLEAIGKVMPTRFAFDGMRHALFGGAWGLDAGVLAAIGLVGIPLSIYVFSSALEQAKRSGTLAQY
jgi:ABC-2 type transport system permease protein